MKMSIIKSDLHTAQEKATAFTQATQQGMELTKTAWDASAGRFIIPSQDSFSGCKLFKKDSKLDQKQQKNNTYYISKYNLGLMKIQQE